MIFETFNEPPNVLYKLGFDDKTTEQNEIIGKLISSQKMLLSYVFMYKQSWWKILEVEQFSA